MWFYALQLQMPQMNYGITIVNIHKEKCKVQSRVSKPGPSWIMDYAINSPPCIICSNAVWLDKKEKKGEQKTFFCI